MTEAAQPITPEMVAQTRHGRPVNTLASQDTDIMLRRAPDMLANVEYWDQTDDIVTGYKAVRDAGEKYLPKFYNETPQKYQFRQRLTKMTNVYRDIVEGLAAKPFETEVTFVEPATDADGKTQGDPVPTDLIKFAEDVDGSGNNLSVFAYGVFFNGINSGIDWIYVDHPVADSTVRNMAEYKARGLRPYWSRVLGRNVFEAKGRMIDGKETLEYLRMFEPGKPDVVRVFKREDNGVVRWATFAKGEAQVDPLVEWLNETPAAGTKTQFALTAEGVITIGRIPLVPFITGRRDGRTFKLYPAMRDAADLQIELYQQESGLKHAKTLTAYPMLAGNGVVPARDAAGNIMPIEVSPASVLYGGRDGNGQAGTWAYVEPAATSLTFLAGDIKDTISNLRELGRQPLTAQSGNLTVITTAVAAGKARSAVGAWAYGLKDSLENATVLTCLFLNIKYDPEVFVHTEFDDGMDDSADVDQLRAARDGNDLSQETYWEELKRRKKLSPDFTAARERQRLLDETPSDTGLDTNPDVTE